jgi:hypothetical protein
MIIICRYWPNPYWDTNAQIAKDTGYGERYIEKIIKSLVTKGYIKRGFSHAARSGRPHTVRVIEATCFPVKSNAKIKWVKPEQMDGKDTEQSDGKRPNSSSAPPEQMGDLLKRNRRIKDKEATPSPLPAGGQAPALLKKAEIERLSAAKFEDRRRPMLDDLKKLGENPLTKVNIA